MLSKDDHQKCVRLIVDHMSKRYAVASALLCPNSEGPQASRFIVPKSIGEGSNGNIEIRMEKVEGLQLKELLVRDEPVLEKDWESIKKGLVEIAEKLEVADLKHKDLNPGNLKVTEEGALVVLDLDSTTSSPQELTVMNDSERIEITFLAFLAKRHEVFDKNRINDFFASNRGDFRQEVAKNLIKKIEETEADDLKFLPNFFQSPQIAERYTPTYPTF